MPNPSNTAEATHSEPASAQPSRSFTRPTPSGHERVLGENELIVSKTDLAGRITYCNRVFQRIAGYSEAELLGAPHSIVRHPDMPRCVFKLLWDTIQDGREIFAYVVNLAKSGDHYWVLAHVTPSFDNGGRIVGFHSNRRAPDRKGISAASALYAQLLAEEKRHPNVREACAAGVRMVTGILTQAGVSYDQWVFSIGESQP